MLPGVFTLTRPSSLYGYRFIAYGLFLLMERTKPCMVLWIGLSC